MWIYLLLLCGILATTRANVIGIDFGSDSMKIALVQPGKPLEIVTNFQSKRKTPTCISFYRGERLFGSDSYALMGRKPEVSYTKFYRMVGRSMENPSVSEIKSQFFPYEIFSNESGFTSFKHESTSYTPEELLAMMMQHAKDMTNHFGGKVIQDCVITVPSYFTQHEKRALQTAAEIAGLNVLSFIEENTAAALHYAIDRVFESHKVLYYNMGSASTQVNIVHYTSLPGKDGKSVGQFEVLGKGSDNHLGGFNFDTQLASLLADRFNQVWHKKPSGKGQDLREHFRPMTRLRLEANKIKEVLSANNDFPFKAEQLHADLDLSTKITRSDFEEACAELFSRLTLPIDQALAQANLTLNDIDAVELLGGSVRIPKVKKTLEDYFKLPPVDGQPEKKIELGQHLNGDEAMALGAAFRAANLSTSFRVRKVGLVDHSPFGVSVSMESLPQEEAKPGFFASLFGGKKTETEPLTSEEAVWSKHTSLYPAGSVVPSKSKVVTFQHDQDILCRIAYEEGASLPDHAHPLLAVYNITGVAAFAKEHADKGLGSPKVHLGFSLNSLGLVSLSRAEATLELPPEPEPVVEASPANETASGSSEEKLEEGASKEEDKEKTPSSEEKAEGQEEEKKPAESAEKTPEPKKKSKKDKKGKKKDNVIRRQLVVDENFSLLSPPAWSPAHVALAKQRLRDMDLIDEQRKIREAALNELEAYIYKVRNQFVEDEDSLKVVSTDEQREEVTSFASSTEDWLYDEGRTAETSAFKAKHSELRKKAGAILKRKEELTLRPAALSEARNNLSRVRAAISEWSIQLPHITEAEKEKLLETIQKAEQWMDEKEASQALRSPFEDPVFQAADVPLQMKSAAQQFEKLMKKPKPAPEKVEEQKTEEQKTEEPVAEPQPTSEEGKDGSQSTSESEKKEEL